MVECPKCQGGAYLVDEELIKVLENTDPMKIIAKATYQCRACGERFSRLIYENLEARKKEETAESGPVTPAATQEPADSLKFLDSL